MPWACSPRCWCSAAGPMRWVGARCSSPARGSPWPARSEEHTSELQSRRDLVCRLLLEKKKESYVRDEDRLEPLLAVYDHRHHRQRREHEGDVLVQRIVLRTENQRVPQ